MTPAIVLQLALIGWPSSPPQAADDVATILAAWKQREETIRSFRVDWVDDEFQPAGSLQVTAAQPPFPPKDTKLHLEGSYTVSGGKIRNVFRDYVWSVPTGECNREDSKTVFRDGVGKTLIKYNKDYLSGYIGRKYYYSGEIHIIPIYMALRPGSQHAELIDPATVFVQARFEREGRRVVVLRTASPKGFTEDVHLIPSENYKVIRYEQFNKDNPIIQIDVSYRFDHDHGWLPTGWTTTCWTSQKKVMKTCHVRVVKCEVNMPVDEDAFTLEFPAGTVVTDVPKQERFVVLDHGARRTLARSEWHRVSGNFIRNVLEESRRSWARRSILTAVYASLAVAFGVLAMAIVAMIRSRGKRPA